MIPKQKIILGSGSPRRKDLLQQLGFDFEVNVIPVAENYPKSLKAEEVAPYLSEVKAKAHDQLKDSEVLITADTVVIFDGKVLGKPECAAEANKMLTQLSDNKSQVVTGVTLKTSQGVKTFSETTTVYFNTLTPSEIDYYIKHYQPFDKAGAYGIQEWIGQIGIYRIEGCFYNVMGLPLSRLWNELKKDISI